MHRARAAALMAAVDGLVRGGRASLTQIGRSLATKTTPKHAIKRIDRLFGNARLHRELPLWYRAIAARLLAGMKTPIVLMDWTHIRGDYWALCAAIPFVGRAIPLLVEVHDARAITKRRVHERFLVRLREMSAVRPVVVVDAEFCRPFFTACARAGVDFVVRLRGSCRLRGSDPQGIKASELATQAGRHPRLIGRYATYDTARQGPTLTIVLAKSCSRARRASDAKYRRRALEAWVLATSIQDVTAAKIVELYGKRMQIEETFRDTKDARYGWSLAFTVSSTSARLNVLFLISTLAFIATVLVGRAAERAGLAARFQASSIRTRRVLSVFHVGSLLLTSSRGPFPSLFGICIAALL
jgi:hypothetical protein